MTRSRVPRITYSTRPGSRLTMLSTSEDYSLSIRQGPERARVAGLKEKGTVQLFRTSICHARETYQSLALLQIGNLSILPLSSNCELGMNRIRRSKNSIGVCFLHHSNVGRNYLQSPYFFMCCNLLDANHERPAQQAALAGTLVSSLHRLKDVDNSGRYFQSL